SHSPPIPRAHQTSHSSSKKLPNNLKVLTNYATARLDQTPITCYKNVHRGDKATFWNPHPGE
ncbi:MAG: hypothetical protein V3W08_08245, partial [Candidatus Binatia bacterium]